MVHLRRARRARTAAEIDRDLSAREQGLVCQVDTGHFAAAHNCSQWNVCACGEYFNEVARLLTESPVKIPGAAYEADGPQTGRLRLGDAQIRLHSQPGA